MTFLKEEAKLVLVNESQNKTFTMNGVIIKTNEEEEEKDEGEKRDMHTITENLMKESETVKKIKLRRVESTEVTAPPTISVGTHNPGNDYDEEDECDEDGFSFSFISQLVLAEDEPWKKPCVIRRKISQNSLHHSLVEGEEGEEEGGGDESNDDNGGGYEDLNTFHFAFMMGIGPSKIEIL